MNLLTKYEVYHREPFKDEIIVEDFQLALSPDKMGTKNYKVFKKGKKPIENIGYTFSFTRQAPIVLHKMGYFSGFGNSNGRLEYEMVEVSETNKLQI